MKALLDTNIIIDTLQSRKGFAEDANFVILQAFEYDGYIAATSVTDIYHVQRKYHQSQEKAKREFEKILKLYNVTDITGSDCHSALRSDVSDYEDAILIESVKRSGMDCIVTRNTKDFKNSVIKAYTPVEFLNLLKN